MWFLGLLGPCNWRQYIPLKRCETLAQTDSIISQKTFTLQYTTVKTSKFVKFNVLLTVHHAMILGNCPTWRTNSFECIYLFIVLYMFRACHAHHQEKQIVLIQLLVIVTPCWWQCGVLVGSKLPTSTRHCHQHWVTITRSCIDTICFSWWWAWHARNMLRTINK